MIVGVEHIEPQTRVDHDSPRPGKLAGSPARSAPHADRLARKRKLLNSLIAELANEDVATPIEGEIVGELELARVRPRCSPYRHQARGFVVDVEDLDAVIACVGNPQVPVGSQLQGLRAAKLADSAPVATPLSDHSALGIELLDPIILAVFADIQAAVACLHRVGHEAEFARPRSFGAADRATFEQLSPVSVHQQPVIVRIGHQQSSPQADRQTDRFPPLDRRCPPVAEESTVSVENLNTPRNIDDVQLLVVVDGDRARALEPTGRNAATPPYFVDSRRSRVRKPAPGRQTARPIAGGRQPSAAMEPVFRRGLHDGTERAGRMGKTEKS